jgi:hypothetical protein
MDIRPPIPFPTDYTPLESDEFYRGYWEGLNEWQDLSARVARRDKILAASFWAWTGATVGSVITALVIAVLT